MKKLSLILAFLLIIFTAVLIKNTKTEISGSNDIANIESAEIEEASQRKNSVFNQRNVIGKENFPLTIMGKRALPVFLTQVGLGSISNLETVDGSEKLNQKMCNLIFKKYKIENSGTEIAGKQCQWNINKDGTYADVDPLQISFSEFNKKYLLLLIDEEGLGAPALFTYLYDLEKEKVLTFSRPSLGQTVSYHQDDVIYFVNFSGYLELAFDIKTMLTIPIENPSI